MIDTDKAIQELRQGDSFSEEQARRIVRVVARADERAATAQDLERTHESLQSDLSLLSKDVDARIAESEATLTNRVYVAAGASVVAIGTLLAVFEFLV